jgi:hypothetical protein
MLQHLRMLVWLSFIAPGVAWSDCHPNCLVGAPGNVTIEGSGDSVNAATFRSTDKFVLGAGLGYAFPHEPLKAEQLYVKLIPGVWSSSAEHEDYLVSSEFRGYLLAGSLVYGINRNWGITFTGVWEQSRDGSSNVVAVTQGGASRQISLPGEAHGFIAALGAIYDPVAGERFRLPIAFGVGYNYYSATVEGTFGINAAAGGTRTFRYYGNHNVSRFSLFLGVAPQFDYRNFRFIPFIVTSDSAFFDGRGTSTARLEESATGAVREAPLSYNEVTYLSGGLTVKYVPWNVGLSYIRGDLKDRGIDTSLFSLSLEKKW